MGTNYYFLTRDKALAQECFAQKTDCGVENKEYRLVEDPYLAYEIHICKFSYGWRALFQGHHCYNSLKELDRFYLKHSDQLEIYDEYQRLITWNELRESAIARAKSPPAPQKWVYDLNPLCRYSAKKTLYTIDCTPEEAELWTPFDHVIYQKTEMDACSRLHLPPTYIWRVKYWNDPDYPVDWTEGEFS